MLTISVLGPLVIRIDGNAVKVPKKARALLAFLAVTGQVSRNRIADLLWPYQESVQARHSLRNCLLEARKAVGPAIRPDFVNCALGDDTQSDFGRFTELARSTDRLDLREACSMYRGEFLDELDVVSEPWEEWLEAKRAELKAMASVALTAFAKLSSAIGDHDEAVEAASRLVQLDPYSEPFHQRLMQALVAGGRRSEAIQHYRKLERLLKVELGVAPDHATQLLIVQIVGGNAIKRPAQPIPCFRQGQALVPPPAPALLDDLDAELTRLSTAMMGWSKETGGITKADVHAAGRAMLAARDERRATRAIHAPSEERGADLIPRNAADVMFALEPLRERVAA